MCCCICGCVGGHRFLASHLKAVSASSDTNRMSSNACVASAFAGGGLCWLLTPLSCDLLHKHAVHALAIVFAPNVVRTGLVLGRVGFVL